MPARVATVSSETWPESTMAERDGVTMICSSGKTLFSSSAAAVTSTSTRRSKLRERSSSSQISRETSPAERPCTRTWVGVTTEMSATAGSVTETRLSRSLVLMSRDLPTITRSGAAPVASFGEGTEADEGCSTCAGDCWAGACWPAGAGLAGSCCKVLAHPSEDNKRLVARVPPIVGAGIILRYLGIREDRGSCVAREKSIS